MAAWMLFCTFVMGAPHLHAQSLFDYPSTVVYGRDVASLRTSTDRCRQICMQNSACEAFDHTSRNGMCRLYNVVTSAGVDQTSTAGAKRLIPNYRDPTNPPAPAVEEEIWYFARFSSIDLYGFDINGRGYRMANEQACSSSCESDRSCRAYTYNAVNSLCFLKSGFQFAQRVNGADAGLYFKSRPSDANKYLRTEWELFLSTDIPGSDLYTSPAQTYEQCMNDCKVDAQCTGYTWVPKRKRNWCFLKTGYSFRYEQTRSSGIVSARKIDENIMPSSITPVTSRD